MKVRVNLAEQVYTADLTCPIDISIPLIDGASGPKCFHAPDVTITPVVAGDWIGSTLEGSPVNFKNVQVNPHGNGTHTECVGHISTEPVYINEVLLIPMCTAQLISCQPEPLDNGDFVLDEHILKSYPIAEGVQALIIRTLPNTEEKLTKDYSDNNPPYLTDSLIHEILRLGIQHLLLDLPSVDRESDGGALSGHKAFWQYPETLDKKKTITEMIFVNNSVSDGLYLCDIQTINIALDASPSRPILYKLVQT